MFKEVGILTATSLLGTLVSLILFPVLTRVFSVENFATYGYVMSIISILSVIMIGRVDQAIINESEGRERELAAVGVIILLVISTLSFISISLISSLSIAIIVSSSITALGSYQIFYAIEFKRSRTYSCATLVFLRISLIPISQLIGFYFLDIKQMEKAIVLYALMIGIIPLVYIVFYAKMPRISTFKSIRYFIVGYSSHGLINAFSHNLPYILLNFLSAKELLGFYTIIERLCKRPLLLVSGFIRQSFLKRFAHMTEQQAVTCSLRWSSILLFLSLFGYLLSLFVQDKVFVSVLGDQWSGISFYFYQIAISFCFIFMNPPIFAFLVSRSRFKLLVSLQVIEILMKALMFTVFIAIIESQNYLFLAFAFTITFYNICLYFSVLAIKVKILKQL